MTDHYTRADVERAVREATQAGGCLCGDGSAALFVSDGGFVRRERTR